MGSDPNHRDPDYQVVVVGAGFAGLGAGIKLKQLGIDDFVILERRSDVGGTWRDNTYPGVGVDIPSFTYSYHFDQNPDWSRVFAPGHELMQYALDVTERHGLRSYLRFNTEVRTAEFDEQEHFWRLTLINGEQLTARFLISCHGVLVTPTEPNIPGLGDFGGKILRSASWDHDYDLAGKRVAVIGTGASGIQIIPAIAKTVAHLDVYQRTPIWVIPKPNLPLHRWVRLFFRRVPLAQNLVRALTTVFSDGFVIVGAVHNKQLPFLVKAAQGICSLWLKIQVRDRAIRQKLKPHYTFGCKRPSFSNTYWPTFNRKNVELVTDSIASVTADGIRTQDGTERSADAIVLATGFKVFDVPYRLVGIDGVDLGTFWAAERKQAYQGVALPKFPNMFLVPGAYGVSGASWFGTIDLCLTHTALVIQETLRRSATWVAPTDEAHQRFWDKTLAKVQDEIFISPGCAGSNSYYTDEHGDAPFLRPALGLVTWFSVRRFDRSDYSYRIRPDGQKNVEEANPSSMQRSTV